MIRDKGSLIITFAMASILILTLLFGALRRSDEIMQGEYVVEAPLNFGSDAADLKTLLDKLDKIRMSLSKPIDYDKFKKLEELSGYVPDSVLEEKGAKYIFTEMMEYNKAHTQGITDVYDSNMNPQNIVWVLITKYNGSVEVEPEKFADNPVFVELFDAETGKPLGKIVSNVKYLLEELK